MFDELFDVVIADTFQSKEINYKIRYKVYCELLGFEGVTPNQMEMDECDNYSTHFIVKHKASNNWVGAIRLIHQTDILPPIFSICNITKPKPIQIDRVVNSYEISRLCILNDIQDSTYTDDCKALGLCGITRGLIYALSSFAYVNKMMVGYFITSKGVARLLQRVGIHLEQIGTACEHHGI